MVGEGIAAGVEGVVPTGVDWVGVAGVSFGLEVGDGVSLRVSVSVAVGFSGVLDGTISVKVDVGVAKNACIVLHPSKNTKYASRARMLIPKNHGKKPLRPSELDDLKGL